MKTIVKIPFAAFLIAYCLLLTAHCFSQGTWTQKANLGVTGRHGATGFSIGTKGYVGTGYDDAFFTYKKDFWEWDQTTNVWTQKANFGGTARDGAVGFSIGTKGYIGTGGIFFSSFYRDFWEWDGDPSSLTYNTWTQKTNFGGTARGFATGFSIGNKGYIGIGRDSIAGYCQDFWEWDQTNDTWTQKAMFGGTARDYAVGFSIGNKGYIGTGSDASSASFKQDFWEWDQTNDAWIQKSDFGGTARYRAVGFSIGTKGYIGTGLDGGQYQQDFWEWDQANDTWIQKANFGGTARIFAVGFSMGNKGYIGTGENLKDFWEYDPSGIYPAPEAYFKASDTTICEGDAISFTDSSSFTISWNWSFPGGIPNASSLQNPVVAYNTVGTYNVTLIVSGLGGSDTLIKTNYITAAACPGQGQWTQRANFGGTARTSAAGFSIGTKGYIGMGYDGSFVDPKDLREWDQAANAWTQKAMLGLARNGAVGFSIGTKGYIGTGSFTKDFWEWDQTTNTWTQKANFGGTARSHAVGFSIGTKGYIGTGQDASGYCKDFWEWDQATNVWTQKAIFGGTARNGAVGFSIGNKGYIGTGQDISGFCQDFWQWNQTTNVWTQKTMFGGMPRYGAAGFSIGIKGYIGTGQGNSSIYYKDFWGWDQTTNSWTKLANYSGTPRYNAIGFSIGYKGYIGTGVDNNSDIKQDFWEYDPMDGTSINENPVENSVSIFPNPTTGKFVIKIDKQQPAVDKINLEIYNVTGEKIYQTAFQTPELAIDISNQPGGVYFLNIKIGKGFFTKKIIVQK